MDVSTVKDVMSGMNAIDSVAPDKEVRILRRAEIGTCCAHQGDVYLHRVPNNHPKGKELGSRQVAVGSTVGARHIVVGDSVRVYEGIELPRYFTSGAFKDELLGPVVVAEKTFTLTHPEHAHHQLPAGIYQVTYQLDFTTKRRVLD